MPIARLKLESHAIVFVEDRIEKIRAMREK